MFILDYLESVCLFCILSQVIILKRKYRITFHSVLSLRQLLLLLSFCMYKFNPVKVGFVSITPLIYLLMSTEDKIYAYITKGGSVRAFYLALALIDIGFGK